MKIIFRQVNLKKRTPLNTIEKKWKVLQIAITQSSCAFLRCSKPIFERFDFYGKKYFLYYIKLIFSL